MAVTSSTLQSNPRNFVHFDRPILAGKAHTAVTLSGAVTMTVDQLATGWYEADPGGAGRTVTLPTAAAIVAHVDFQGVEVGQCIPLVVVNTADAGETITIAVGTGINTVVGNVLTIAQNARKQFVLKCTGIGSSAAFSLYNVTL